jgi:hypothetical protein
MANENHRTIWGLKVESPIAVSASEIVCYIHNERNSYSSKWGNASSNSEWLKDFLLKGGSTLIITLEDEGYKALFC